jgi:hypothetical protein
MANPINLPAIHFASCEFDPVRPRDTNRMEGRRTESQSFGTPYWVAKYTTPWMETEDFGLMDAFMMSAGDDGETFLAYDAFRPRPILQDNHKPLSGTKAAGGAFNGDAVLQTIVSALMITVSGLPAGFKLSPGDYVEIRKSLTVRSLHRVSAFATSNGSGNCTFPIKYALDLQTFTLPCTVHFEKPSCIMQIDPGSWSASKSWESRSVSFSATEVFFS